MKTDFFDYYNRAKTEGLTDAEAYRWAITEDLYDADDNPISPEQVTADGMCYHPVRCVERRNDIHGGICGVCGAMLSAMHAGVRDGSSVLFTCADPKYDTQPVYFGKPCKIPTRRETAVGVFAGLPSLEARDAE